MSRLALLHPAVIGMGLRVAAVRARRAARGHRRYEGSAEDILRAGLEACWTGESLTASPVTYRHFWTRDLGFAAPALQRLGAPWPDRLRSSLAWALDTWRRRGSHVTTTIDPLFRQPVDVFDYGVDSLPWLVASLRVAGADDLALEHADWLAGEVADYADQVVDPLTGLVRADRHLSAHRDTFKSGSTAYGNTMVAMLARDVVETGWAPDLLSRHFVDDVAGGAPDWSLLLRRQFWTGDRFRDRLGTDATSGEANVWPFHVGLVDIGTEGGRSMLAAAMGTLRREGFATPYPLKFEVDHRTDGQLWAFRFWSADYQTTTSWTSLGSVYLSLLRQLDPDAASVELRRMRELIERDGTFWEVLDARGGPWRSASGLSISDASMLWGAILLTLLEEDPVR